MTKHQVTTPTIKRTTAKASVKPIAASKAGIAKSPVALIAKKPVSKKPVAMRTITAAAETKKTKAPAVKKMETAAAAKTAPIQKTANVKALTQEAPMKKLAPAEVKPSSTEKEKPTPEERYRMVETTAYFIAERNGFRGDSTEHWAAAEREIAAKLGR